MLSTVHTILPVWHLKSLATKTMCSDLRRVAKLWGTTPPPTSPSIIIFAKISTKKQNKTKQNLLQDMKHQIIEAFCMKSHLSPQFVSSCVWLTIC